MNAYESISINKLKHYPYTQNYWLSGLCPSPGIPNTRKQRFGNCTCSILRSRKGDSYSVRSLRKG
jgi:hypothetical protein